MKEKINKDRPTYVDGDGVKRHKDDDTPVDGQLLIGNTDLVPALHATLSRREPS